MHSRPREAPAPPRPHSPFKNQITSTTKKVRVASILSGKQPEALARAVSGLTLEIGSDVNIYPNVANSCTAAIASIEQIHWNKLI